MKTNLTKILVAPFVILALTACSVGKSVNYGSNSESSILDPSCGGGCKVAGTGALSVPVGDSLVVRVQNALDGSVTANAGNFKLALTQVRANLPKVTDPTKATGFDQA